MKMKNEKGLRDHTNEELEEYLDNSEKIDHPSLVRICSEILRRQKNDRKMYLNELNYPLG